MTLPRQNGAAGPLRCLGVWSATSSVAAPLLVLLVADLRTSSSAASTRTSGFDAALTTVCEAVAVVGLGWLWLLVTVLTVAAARGLSADHAGVPRSVRRMVLAACGAGLAGGLAAPVHAHTAPDSPEASQPARHSSAVVGLQLPDRVTTTTLPAPEGRPASVRAPRAVVVVPGDTLWALAAADLPPAADEAAIDAHWRAIHAANRAVIGADPDLIRPGQRLRLPFPHDPEPHR